MAGEPKEEPHYLLFVILAVHVQHKQVVAQAADGDACNGEQPFDTRHSSLGHPVPGTQQLLVPHQETPQLGSCAEAARLKTMELLFRMGKKVSDASVPQEWAECLFTNCHGPLDWEKRYLCQLRDL